MEKYLQNLVIILPALAIAMGGLHLVVFIYSRSRIRVSDPNLPVPQRSVATQVNKSLQMSHEIRNKMIEDAMGTVKSILSEEFRKKQATKISQEEFNNLYRKQRGPDSGDGDDEKRRRQEMESAFRIPGVASLACAPTTRDSASLQMTDSFATLWVEELQKSGDGDSFPDTQKECELPEKEPTVEALPKPQHSIVASSDSFGTTQNLGLGQATALNDVKSPNEMRPIQDLEIFLLTASSNLRRSMMTLSIAHNKGEEGTLNSNKELSMVPGHRYLDHGAEVFASVASTSMNVPQLIKGGAPTDDFEWRIDIEEKDVKPSPPNTPVRRRPPSHLCRGVRFEYEMHPPALSLIDLDPEQGSGWRGLDWKETFGKYHIYKYHEGPSIYRKQKRKLASDPSVAEYYKSIKSEAKRRWETIKNRYREARELALLKASLHEDIHESAEWRKYLRTLHSDSSSLSSISDHEDARSGAGQHGETEQNEASQNDPNRVNSMLTTSSSSVDSDESSVRVRQPTNISQCKRKHQHCDVFEIQKSSSSG